MLLYLKYQLISIENNVDVENIMYAVNSTYPNNSIDNSGTIKY